jgi:hypothetical protein
LFVLPLFLFEDRLVGFVFDRRTGQHASMEDWLSRGVDEWLHDGGLMKHSSRLEKRSQMAFLASDCSHRQAGRRKGLFQKWI